MNDNTTIGLTLMIAGIWIILVLGLLILDRRVDDLGARMMNLEVWRPVACVTN